MTPAIAFRWFYESQGRKCSLAIAVAVALAWFTGTSQTYQDCINGHSERHGDKAANESISSPKVPPSRRACIGTFLNDNTGAITGLGTLAIAIFTLTLWLTTGRTLNHLEREFIAKHRPHVGFRPRIYSYKGEPTEHGYRISVNFPYRFVNVGDSLATITKVAISYTVKWECEPIAFLTDPEPQPLSEPIVLAEGQRSEELVYEGVGVWNPLTAVPRKPDEGPTDLILFGTVLYRDANGRERERGFCRIHSFQDINVNSWATIHDPQREYDD